MISIPYPSPGPETLPSPINISRLNLPTGYVIEPGTIGDLSRLMLRTINRGRDPTPDAIRVWPIAENQTIRIVAETTLPTTLRKKLTALMVELCVGIEYFTNSLIHLVNTLHSGLKTECVDQAPCPHCLTNYMPLMRMLRRESPSTATATISAIRARHRSSLVAPLDEEDMYRFEKVLFLGIYTSFNISATEWNLLRPTQVKELFGKVCHQATSVRFVKYYRAPRTDSLADHIEMICLLRHALVTDYLSRPYLV